MAIMFDIYDENDLEREFDRVRRAFREIQKEDGKTPFRVIWGTKESMEKI